MSFDHNSRYSPAYPDSFAAPSSRHTPEQDNPESSNPIVGTSEAIKELVALARRAAVTDLRIMLLGASGTGKELFAQHIHRWSGRPGPLIDLNCGAMPHDMVEALLFGHRRGAFTGASDNVEGLIEAADRGTLFLDELLDLPPEGQVKLLRVLESGETRRLGETVKRKSRFRIIAAIQDDAAARLDDGSFRLDLFERLAGVVIGLPSLLERGEDILVLAEHFARLTGRPLGPGADAVLRAHSWPGNVRELKLAIERAAFLEDGQLIAARTLAESLQRGGAALILGATLQSDRSRKMAQDPRERLLAACAANGWNAARAARALGMGRTTFFKQLKEFNISIRRERSSFALRTRHEDLY